ncbi:MAG TPA: hypothetical protein VF390_02685, partial [Patescibacteria group bacterium]
MRKNFITLKFFYLALILVIILAITFTPLIVTKGISVIDEELGELILIATQFFVAYILYRLYQREIEKSNQELVRALKYIGTTNVEIQ